MGKELMVSSSVVCPLSSSAAGESTSSLGLDFAGFCGEPDAEPGLCEGSEELLDAVSEQPLAPSWAFPHSTGGKKCRSFLGCRDYFLCRGMAGGCKGSPEMLLYGIRCVGSPIVKLSFGAAVELSV